MPSCSKDAQHKSRSSYLGNSYVLFVRNPELRLSLLRTTIRVLKKLLKLVTLNVIFTTVLICKEGLSNLTLNSAAIRLLQPTPTESNLEGGGGGNTATNYWHHPRSLIL